VIDAIFECLRKWGDMDVHYLSDELMNLNICFDIKCRRFTYWPRSHGSDTLADHARIYRVGRGVGLNSLAVGHRILMHVTGSLSKLTKPSKRAIVEWNNSSTHHQLIETLQLLRYIATHRWYFQLGGLRLRNDQSNQIKVQQIMNISILHWITPVSI